MARSPIVLAVLALALTTLAPQSWPETPWRGAATEAREPRTLGDRAHGRSAFAPTGSPYGVADAAAMAPQDFEALALAGGWFQNWGTTLAPGQQEAVRAGQASWLPLIGLGPYYRDPAPQARAAVEAAGTGLWWLVGSEPNAVGDADCCVDDDVLAEQVDGAIAAIKAADPEATIVAPSIVFWGQADRYGERWWGSFIAAYRAARGKSPPFDALNLHLYGNEAARDAAGNVLYWRSDPGTLIDEVEGMRTWADRDPDFAGVPLIVTEFGVLHCRGSACLPGSDPRVQSEVVRTLDGLLPYFESQRERLGLLGWLVFTSYAEREGDVFPLLLFDSPRRGDAAPLRLTGTGTLYRARAAAFRGR